MAVFPDDTDAVVTRLIEYLLGSADLIMALRSADHERLRSERLAPPKVLSEMLLFLRAAQPVVAAHPTLSVAVGDFVRWAHDRILDDGMMARIASHPAEASRVGIILLACARYGIASDRLDRVTALIRSPAYFAAERLPFRHQEAIWIRRGIGATGDMAGAPEMTDMAAMPSLLTRFSHPAVMSRADLYAKTHSAMFVTDFGRARARTDEMARPASLSFAHDLAFCFCNADWDLVGEIGMAQIYLGHRDDRHRNAIDAIRRVFDRFGYIPSITYDAGRMAALPDGQQALYHFVHSYHTTLVFGLLLIAKAAAPLPACAAARDHAVPDAVMTAIVDRFGQEPSTFGPLNPDWFEGRCAIDAETLVDGHASKCFRRDGRDAALDFIADCGATETMPMVARTRDLLATL